MLVIPSSDDQTSPEHLSVFFIAVAPLHLRKRVLVRVAELLKDGGRGLCCRRFVVGNAVHAEVVVYYISYSLCVRRRAGPATPDRVVNLCELVGNSIRNVGTGRRSAVCG